MEIIDSLETAYQHSQGVFSGVTPAQLDDPTPCPLWDVRALVGHALDVMDMITAALAGESAEAGAGERTDNPGQAFAEASDRSLTAWRSIESMDAPLKMPWGDSTTGMSANMQLADILAHTWDLATATGQQRSLPTEPAQAALDFTRSMFRPEYRSDGPDATFGPEVKVPDDAPITDRLIGWLGRNPER